MSIPEYIKLQVSHHLGFTSVEGYDTSLDRTVYKGHSYFAIIVLPVSSILPGDVKWRVRWDMAGRKIGTYTTASEALSIAKAVVYNELNKAFEEKP